ncbi:MAG: restriction endonuclease subunit S [Desulfocapsaceae bacterium]|nr:restriction endonuclease subunit S [Desulfocapsaceae bacterium]
MVEQYLPQSWCEVNLSSLGTFLRGRGGTRADEEAHGLPCIRYGDLYTHHDCIVRSFCSAISPARASAYTSLQFGDIVFAGSGETFEEIGKAVAYCSDGQAYAGADTIIFRPGRGLDSRFAGYAVNSESANNYKSRVGQGSSVIHISAEHLSRLPLLLPPVSQQQHIADILSTMVETIEKTESLIAKYQQIKAGLMHDLFTRGVTADGKLRPPRAQAPELYKETPIGWISKEWECKTLEQLLAPVGNNLRSGPFGSALLKDELVEEGIPFLGIDNIYTEHFEARYRRFVSQKKFMELYRYSVRPKDIVITIMGTVGRCCILPDDIGQALSSKHLWTMTLDQSQVFPELVCWQLNYAPWVLSWFRRESQGAVMDAIQSSTLRTLQLPVPRMSEQDEILGKYLASTSKIDSEISELNKLKKKKAGLMHDLLTGRVQVKETNSAEELEHS